MINEKDLEAVEARSTKVRLTITELCDAVGISYSTWWRWKKGGKVSVKKFRLLEDKLKELETAS